MFLPVTVNYFNNIIFNNIGDLYFFGDNMPGDFANRYNTYRNFGIRDISTNSKSHPKGVKFIKTAIMSIFDGGNKSNKDCLTNGIIEPNEFNQISEKEYNSYIKEMKSYYKNHYKDNLEYHIPTYKELQRMMDNTVVHYEWYDFITEENKKKNITYNEISESIIPDGKIGQSNQEGAGDCYQEAVDIALSLTPEGEKLLSKSIKFDKQGYYVTLYGAQQNLEGKYIPVGSQKQYKKVPRTYYISQKVLKIAQEEKLPNGQKKYNSGDADMVLFSLAVEKYRKDTQTEPEYARNRKNVLGYDDYLSSGKGYINMQLITGKNVDVYRAKQYNVVKPKDYNDPKSTELYTYNEIMDNQKIYEILDQLSANKKSAITCQFGISNTNDSITNNYNLYNAHVYSIKNINPKDKTVTIINPHGGKYDNKYILTIPYSEFAKHIYRIENLNL